MVEWFQTYGAIVQTVALVVTLIVLIWYACETRGLRKASIKQAELSLRPCIHLLGKSIKNIGHSPALNISIEDLEHNVFTLTFKTVNLLEPGKTRAIKFYTKGRSKEADEDIKGFGDDLMDLDFPYFKEMGVQNYSLLILYENMENQKFYTKVKIYCNLRRVKFIATDKV
jgi:hypothetical protein